MCCFKKLQKIEEHTIYIFMLCTADIGITFYERSWAWQSGSCWSHPCHGGRIR